MSRCPVRRVNRWPSPLGPAACPYENRLRLARWFFYKRFEEALAIANPAPDAIVMELGCWEGHFLPSLLGRCSRVIAVENDSASLIERIPGRWTVLELARELCRAECGTVSGLDLMKADGRRLPFRSECFDAVFCLDTLPYVPEEARVSVVEDLARVLKRGRPAVFTLPVEMGPALIAREILRRLSGTWVDRYSASEIISAFLFLPARPGPGRGRTNLAGYDYRLDLDTIASRFAVVRKQYLPSNLLAFVSPTILLACSN